MGNNNIKWTDGLKYLGIQLISNRFSGVLLLHKVYGATNSLLENNKYVSDIVKWNIFESYVFIILTYDIDSVDLSQKQIHELSVCYSNVFRRIFAYISRSLLY